MRVEDRVIKRDYRVIWRRDGKKIEPSFPPVSMMTVISFIAISLLVPGGLFDLIVVC